jgi:lipoprotein-releasing system permease protein
MIGLAWAYFRRRIILVTAACGIMLGVAVLVTVLGVFQGFLLEFQGSIRQFSGDMVLQVPRYAEGGEQELEKLLLEQPEIVSAQPHLDWFGLVGRRGSRSLADPRSADLNGLVLLGVDEQELAIPPAQEEGAVPMQLGKVLADKLGLEVGDTIEVVTHRNGARGPVPVRRSFELTGTFASGRFDLDLDRAFVRRQDLAELARTEPSVTSYKVMLREDVDADLFSEELEQRLEAARLGPFSTPRIRTWRDLGGNFLRAVENQKGMLATVFSFIILVAAYQLIATLLLTVTEKRRDIGVLGALGASPGRIVLFFVGLGLMIATIGTALGLLLGWWLINNLDRVELWLGGGKPIFLPEVYKFDHIPVAIDFPAILMVVGATLAAAALFSLLPAWRAARMRIVHALDRR